MVKKMTMRVSIETTIKSEPDLTWWKSKKRILQHPPKDFDKQMLKAILIFMAGTAGILVGAEPFIHSLKVFLPILAYPQLY